MKSYSAMISIGVLVAAASTGAAAQTKTEQPTAIGVSQGTANEAQSKAKQKGDVATVTRTGPTAGEKAKDIAADTKNKASEGASDTKDGAMNAKDKVTSKTKSASDTTTTSTKP